MSVRRIGKVPLKGALQLKIDGIGQYSTYMHRKVEERQALRKTTRRSIRIMALCKLKKKKVVYQIK